MSIQLPKNVQQIGESPSDKKVYLEDYVITFLEQVKKKSEQAGTVILLYGKREQDEEQTCYFVYGASVKEEANEPEKPQSVFPAYEILGEAVICREGEEPQRKLKDYDGRPGFESILFLVGNGCDNLASLLSGHNARCLGGYYIFYDKNEMMQTILLEWYRDNCAGSTTGSKAERDNAVHEFRERYGSKQEELLRKKMMRGLYAASLLLVMLCCITGISMMNQFEKMMRMQDTIDHLVIALSEKELPEAQPVLSGSVETVGVPDDRETAQMPAAGAEIPDSPQQSVKEKEKSPQSPAGKEEQETPQQSITEKEEQETPQQSITEKEEQKSPQQSATDTKGQEPLQQSAGDTQEQEAIQQSPAGQDGNDTTQKSQEEQTGKEEGGQGGEDIYIVKKGDTLAEISQTYYGTVKKVHEICEANQIQEPDKIRIGQKILLP